MVRSVIIALSLIAAATIAFANNEPDAPVLEPVEIKQGLRDGSMDLTAFGKGWYRTGDTDSDERSAILNYRCTADTPSSLSEASFIEPVCTSDEDHIFRRVRVHAQHEHANNHDDDMSFGVPDPVGIEYDYPPAHPSRKQKVERRSKTIESNYRRWERVKQVCIAMNDGGIAIDGACPPRVQRRYKRNVAATMDIIHDPSEYVRASSNDARGATNESDDDDNDANDGTRTNAEEEEEEYCSDFDDDDDDDEDFVPPVDMAAVGSDVFEDEDDEEEDVDEYKEDGQTPLPCFAEDEEEVDDYSDVEPEGLDGDPVEVKENELIKQLHRLCGNDADIDLVPAALIRLRARFAPILCTRCLTVLPTDPNERNTKLVSVKVVTSSGLIGVKVAEDECFRCKRPCRPHPLEYGCFPFHGTEDRFDMVWDVRFLKFLSILFRESSSSITSIAATVHKAGLTRAQLKTSRIMLPILFLSELRTHNYQELRRGLIVPALDAKYDIQLKLNDTCEQAMVDDAARQLGPIRCLSEERTLVAQCQAVDGDFKLGCILSTEADPGSGPSRQLDLDTFFISSPTKAREYEEENRPRRQKGAKSTSREHKNNSNCTSSFNAEKTEFARNRALRDKPLASGVFCAVEARDFMITSFQWIVGGELLFYMDEHVRFLRHNQWSIKGLAYDIMCKWIVHNDKSCALDVTSRDPPTLMTDLFHAQAHSYSCQVNHSALFKDGMGYTHSSGTEVVWRHLNQIKTVLKACSQPVAELLLNNMAFSWNLDKLCSCIVRRAGSYVRNIQRFDTKCSNIERLREFCTEYDFEEIQEKARSILKSALLDDPAKFLSLASVQHVSDYYTQFIDVLKKVKEAVMHKELYHLHDSYIRDASRAEGNGRENLVSQHIKKRADHFKRLCDTLTAISELLSTTTCGTSFDLTHTDWRHIVSVAGNDKEMRSQALRRTREFLKVHIELVPWVVRLVVKAKYAIAKSLEQNPDVSVKISDDGDLKTVVAALHSGVVHTALRYHRLEAERARALEEIKLSVQESRRIFVFIRRLEVRHDGEESQEVEMARLLFTRVRAASVAWLRRRGKAWRDHSHLYREFERLVVPQ